VRGGGRPGITPPSFGRRFGIGGAARDGVVIVVEDGRGGGKALLGKFGGTFLDSKSDGRPGAGWLASTLAAPVFVGLGGERCGKTGGAGFGFNDGVARFGSAGGLDKGVAGADRPGMGGGARFGEEAETTGGGKRLGATGGLEGKADVGAGGGMALLESNAGFGRGGAGGAGGAGDASRFGIEGGFANEADLFPANKAEPFLALSYTLGSPIALDPVGFNLGIPPARRPASCGGPEPVVALTFPTFDEEGPELAPIGPPFDLESANGALRSFVTAFFKDFPF